jgi:adenylate cyclase
VPQNVFESLRHAFILEERGDVDIKGKGVMHTWYLVGRKPAAQPSGGETAIVAEVLGVGNCSAVTEQ